MSIASFVVIALAFGISDMVGFRQSGGAAPVRLSRGLACALLVGVVQVVVFLVAVRIGDLLRFEGANGADGLMARQNAAVALGLMAFVAVRQLWPYLRREPQLPVFDLRHWGRVAGMAGVMSVNVLLVGIGAGMAGGNPRHVGWLLLAMWVVLSAGSYLGLMYGRQKVKIRPRRWMVLSSILLLGVAIAALVNA